MIDIVILQLTFLTSFASFRGLGLDLQGSVSSVLSLENCSYPSLGPGLSLDHQEFLSLSFGLETETDLLESQSRSPKAETDIQKSRSREMRLSLKDIISIKYGTILTRLLNFSSLY